MSLWKNSTIFGGVFVWGYNILNNKQNKAKHLYLFLQSGFVVIPCVVLSMDRFVKTDKLQMVYLYLILTNLVFSAIFSTLYSTKKGSLKMQLIHSHQVASITELKKNPSKLINEANGCPVAILNHNVAAAYLIPSETFESLLELLDDRDLEKIVGKRLLDKKKTLKVDIDEL